MLALTLALLAALPSAPGREAAGRGSGPAQAVRQHSVVVPGRVSDAFAADLGRGEGLYLTVAESPGGFRGVKALRPGAVRTVEAAPAGAVFVDACGTPPAQPAPQSRARGQSRTAPKPAKARLVWLTASGLHSGGQPALPGESLFVLPDDEALFVADLCAGDAAPGELRFPVRGGLAVGRPGEPPRVLRWPHRGRAYSGRVHRGLRPDRPYAAAASVYAPHLVDADVDGDGRADLVAFHEDRLAAYLRGPQGRLSPAPAVRLDLREATGEPGGDLRVHAGDLDGDGTVDFVIGRAEGILAERSSAWWLRSKAGPLDDLRRLWDEEGLIAPLAVVDRPAGSDKDPHAGPAIVTTALETSLVGLGAVVVSGRMDVPLSLRRPRGRSTVAAAGPTLEVDIDIRAMKMGGALPVTGVDLDQDGLSDLLDVGTPGRAALYRGTATGYEATPSRTFSIPRFVHVVPLPSVPAVVLIGAPRHQRAKSGEAMKTTVTWLQP